MNSKQAIEKILATLPWAQRQKVIEAGKKYQQNQREELSPEVVERLYLQVIKEAKERGNG